MEGLQETILAHVQNAQDKLPFLQKAVMQQYSALEQFMETNPYTKQMVDHVEFCIKFLEAYDWDSVDWKTCVLVFMTCVYVWETLLEYTTTNSL